MHGVLCSYLPYQFEYVIFSELENSVFTNEVDFGFGFVLRGLEFVGIMVRSNRYGSKGCHV